MMNYQVCPRCHQVWHQFINKLLSCDKCQVDYLSSICLERLSISNFLQLDDQLFFDFLLGYCEYVVYVKNEISQNIKLPMLPIDISADKLKLYLTFS